MMNRLPRVMLDDERLKKYLWKRFFSSKKFETPGHWLSVIMQQHMYESRERFEYTDQESAMVFQSTYEQMVRVLADMNEEGAYHVQDDSQLPE